MKKFLCVLCVLAVGASSFAANGKFGLDFSWGLNFGFQNLGLKDEGMEGKLKRTDLALPVVRVSSYNFFLLDNMLGAFASANISAGLQFGDKIVSGGESLKGGGMIGSISDAFIGLEFMVGPSFGIDINEDLRFQTGLGFHYLYEKSLTESIANGYAEDGTVIPSISLHSFGIGLTPQLRFSPSKKTSLVLGCDFIFDFGRGKNTTGVYQDYERETATGFESGSEWVEIPANQIQKYFRFGMSPYIGVGINF